MAMATSGSSSATDALCDINTTPLIDVMLVLLIMFIITIPIMTHAVKLDLPRPPHLVPPTPPEVIDLEVDADGTVIYNGTVVPDIATLERYFRAAASKQQQPEIHLRPDRRAHYGVVAVVMAAAQRNHLQKIGFVSTPEYAEGASR